MKPENKSKTLLAITQAKAKNFEFNLSETSHIDIRGVDLMGLIDLTIGILGESAAIYSNNTGSERLLFSAQYFDSLLTAIPSGTDFQKYYFRILGSCAYYLNGFPGSAQVILKHSNGDIDLEVNLLDKFLYYVIQKNSLQINIEQNNPYRELLNALMINLSNFSVNGNNGVDVLSCAKNLKKEVYRNGSDRELLFSDLILASATRYINTSLWHKISEYSNLDRELWSSYIRTHEQVREFWPAQIKLGENGIFRGDSGIIQMPTSAGKTKAMDILIRSYLLKNESAFVVFIAPFRSLCREIYNNTVREFSDMEDLNINIASDVFQYDLELSTEYITEKNILIATPEKFDFIIRHNPELVSQIGLIIFDEAHLFDDVGRGTQYELLLSYLKNRLQENTQIILISAVIPNDEEVGRWLIGESCRIVKASDLTPTSQAIAFASWVNPLGRLNFVEKENINSIKFFVPRIIESQNLTLNPNERSPRFFPEKNDTLDVSLFLGCKIINRGGVAIFAGRKDTAAKLTERIVNVFNRGLNSQKPSEFSDEVELRKFVSYYTELYGEDSFYTKAARLGIFAHHASVPRGARLSIEFAMDKQLIRYIICTSTLAQGINMPIKYLIIVSQRQGRDLIRTRDFHNLVGRAGRAGYYTEGVIIFADPRLYDQRINFRNRWRWRQISSLLDKNKSENCLSTIHVLFEPEPEDEEEKNKWVFKKNNVVDSIKSYLLDALLGFNNVNDAQDSVFNLVENTLAYYQANDEQKEILKTAFLGYASEIFEVEENSGKRAIFAKSLLSINDTIEIDNFIENHLIILSTASDPIILLETIWPIIFSKSKIREKIRNENVAFELCKLWIEGQSFSDILTFLTTQDLVTINRLNIDSVITYCEEIIGFDISLIISTFTELLAQYDIENEYRELNSNFNILQKMTKYGLSDIDSIIIYELGLVDRKLSQWVKNFIDQHYTTPTKTNIKNAIAESHSEIENFIKENYPSYFSESFAQIMLEYT